MVFTYVFQLWFSVPFFRYQIIVFQRSFLVMVFSYGLYLLVLGMVLSSGYLLCFPFFRYGCLVILYSYGFRYGSFGNIV